MILYLDTSAFLKLYLTESRSEAVQGLVAGASAVYTHLITYAEMRAALARAVHMKRLTESELHHQVARFEEDWLRVAVIHVDDVLIRRAGELADRFALRGYDSVHAAAVERLHQSTGSADALAVASFDGELGAAVMSLGINTVT